MREKMAHSKRDGHKTVTLHGQRIAFLSQRADISMLIHEMEHDKSLHAPTWQLESLKKTLKEIERQLHQRHFPKG